VKQVTSLDIVGDIRGGDGNQSGSIIGNDNLFDAARCEKIHIRGNIEGGMGNSSGGISSNARTGLEVDQSVRGGSGDHSGYIRLRTAYDVPKVVMVRIGGDLIGGIGRSSGFVSSIDNSSIVNVSIGGDVREVSTAYSRSFLYPLLSGA
jgi:hypothetical protein